MKLSVPLIVEIIKFLSTGHFFKKHVYLCKRIARDPHLKREMCQRHLGIIVDYEHELLYHPWQTRLQYDSIT